MGKWKAAVVGCGKPRTSYAGVKQGFAVGYQHGEAYDVHPDVDLVAAVDVSPENLHAFCEKFNVPRGYADFEEMLSEEKPDLVSVCTWPRMHKDMVLAAARAGAKGIFCEKPMAVTYADCVEMHETCKSLGVVLNVAHQRRYDFDYVEAKKAIDRGDIGNVLRMEAWVGDGWDMMSWGTHWVDMMLYLNGDVLPRNVIAQADVSSRKIHYQHPVEDQIVIQIQFDNGVLGVIHMRPDRVEPGNIVVGDGGLILLPDKNGDLSIFTDSGRNVLKKPEGYVFGIGHHRAVEELIKAIETGKPSQLDSASALVTMQIIMAAYESARTSRVVRMPFEEPGHPLETWYEELAAKA